MCDQPLTPCEDDVEHGPETDGQTALDSCNADHERVLLSCPAGWFELDPETGRFQPVLLDPLDML